MLTKVTFIDSLDIGNEWDNMYVPQMYNMINNGTVTLLLLLLYARKLSIAHNYHIIILFYKF